MKKFLFVLFLIFCFLFVEEVEADSSVEAFHAGDFVSDIVVALEYNGTYKNHPLKFIYDNDRSRVAYCLEPFVSFVDGVYEKIPINNSFTEEEWEILTLLAYYGYGYQHHTDDSWYIITQMMIWQEVMPEASFYFTDGIGGNVIDPFVKEKEEIWNLVNKHLLKPSFENREFNLVQGEELIIEDTNKKIINYTLTTNIKGLTQTNNTVTIRGLETGSYDVKYAYQNGNLGENSVYYYSNNSQNIIARGNPVVMSTSFKYNVFSTSLSINKLDMESLSKNNKYDSKLEGAIYHIYNDNYFEEIIIDEDKEVKIDNLPFGQYYIKEISAGYGYLVNNEIETFTISEDNLDVTLFLTNQLIKKRVELFKVTSDSGTETVESNIEFAIYDEDNNLINTVITNNNGYAYIDLSYGTYLVKQLNTTDGFEMVEDFYISVNDQVDNYIYDLVDWKIKVPDTGTTMIVIERLVYLIEKKYSFIFN